MAHTSAWGFLSQWSDLGGAHEYGIEPLDADARPDHRGGVHVPLVNEASGERRQIAVPERG